MTIRIYCFPEILIKKFAQFLITFKNLIDIAKQTLFMMRRPTHFLQLQAAPQLIMKDREPTLD